MTPGKDDIPAALERAEKAGCELVERLRHANGFYDFYGHKYNMAGHVAHLERELRERLRVNVGLLVENSELKRERDA